MALTEILLLILIIVSFVFGVYLIITLTKLNHVLDLVLTNESKLRKKTEPILEKLHYLSIKTMQVSNKIEKKVYQVGYEISVVKNLVDNFISVTGNKASRKAVSDLLVNAVAVSRSVALFWKRIKKK